MGYIAVAVNTRGGGEENVRIKPRYTFSDFFSCSYFSLSLFSLFPHVTSPDSLGIPHSKKRKRCCEQKMCSKNLQGKKEASKSSLSSRCRKYTTKNKQTERSCCLSPVRREKNKKTFCQMTVYTVGTARREPKV